MRNGLPGGVRGELDMSSRRRCRYITVSVQDVPRYPLLAVDTFSFHGVHAALERDTPERIALMRSILSPSDLFRDLMWGRLAWSGFISQLLQVVDTTIEARLSYKVKHIS